MFVSLTLPLLVGYLPTHLLQSYTLLLLAAVSNKKDMFFVFSAKRKVSFIKFTVNFSV